MAGLSSEVDIAVTGAGAAGLAAGARRFLLDRARASETGLKTADAALASLRR